MTITRRQAREWAIQMLTAADLNPQATADEMIADFWAQLPTLDAEDGGFGGEKVGRKMQAFADERVRGVLAARAELDERLNALLGDWPMDRLGTVERAVLRLGAWELENADVPPAVVINEAVDLVNWFSSPKSRTIVNGVLDRLAKTH